MTGSASLSLPALLVMCVAILPTSTSNTTRNPANEPSIVNDISVQFFYRLTLLPGDNGTVATVRCRFHFRPLPCTKPPNTQLGEPTKRVYRGCGSEDQSCTCTAIGPDPVQPTVFLMQVCKMLARCWQDATIYMLSSYRLRTMHTITQGSGTQGNDRGLEYDCSFRLAYVDMETATISKSCDCTFYVKIHDNDEPTPTHNKFTSACSCIGPLTATIDPNLQLQYLADVAS